MGLGPEILSKVTFSDVWFIEVVQKSLFIFFLECVFIQD